MNEIPAAVWSQILPEISKRCPRLTPLDLTEAQGRIDLLTAKIQNRHWVSKTEARRMILVLLKNAGVAVA